jgi:hypothetical protein
MRCAVLHAVPLTGETQSSAAAGGQRRGGAARGGVVVGLTKGFLYAAGGGPVAPTGNSSGTPGPFVAALNLSINARMNPPDLSMYLPLLGPASYLQARARLRRVPRRVQDTTQAGVVSRVAAPMRVACRGVVRRTPAVTRRGSL